MKKYSRQVKLMIASAVLLCGFAPFLYATVPADHQATQPRPIQLGVSGGSIDNIDGFYCCGGTLGSVVEDQDGTQYILSNNHVLARGNRGVSGEDMIQPALIEAGCVKDPQDVVADLTGYVKILFGPENVVDAAIAQVRSGRVDPSGSILGIGPVSPNTMPASLGLKVKKAGRTTGVTFGEVTSIDVSAKVSYAKRCGGSGGQTALFVNQILVSPGTFSAGGDSGSLVVEDVADSPRAVGLLFAGSSTYTLANPIDAVLSAFGVTMIGGVLPPPTPTAPPPTPTPTPQPQAVGEVAGRVVALSDGRPVVGAKVSVDTGQSASTNSNGDYRISNVPTGQRTVKATAKKYLTQTQIVTVVESTTTIVDFSLGQRTSGKPGIASARPTDVEKVREVKARNQAGLQRIPGVAGSGVGLTGKGQAVIDVYLEQDSIDILAEVPTAVEGIPTRVIVTGPFEAF